MERAKYIARDGPPKNRDPTLQVRNLHHDEANTFFIRATFVALFSRVNTEIVAETPTHMAIDLEYSCKIKVPMLELCLLEFKDPEAAPFYRVIDTLTYGSRSGGDVRVYR
ncbi:hypothetical protein PM082_006517 [Marasmius tenuissimus]|nr:hypothetical protein PM082_006517 [Marasmius tenuissimus]